MSMNRNSENFMIAVVIPCYRVVDHVMQVISEIGHEVAKIYCIDDACPDESGEYIISKCTDPRVVVIKHEKNQGVGGAVITGYRAAIADGVDVIVKIDGDGQMDPMLIPSFIHPIANEQADYCKGNRFWDLEEIRAMPRTRRFGNLGLSFFSKLSTGYWDIFDPTNGYTAIHARVAENLPLNQISRRYFFETDILFRLNTMRAVVVDVPMHSKYGAEISNLKVATVLPEFAAKNAKNFIKRIFYNYYLRDLSLASMELALGVLLLSFGGIYGIANWLSSHQVGESTPVGTIMICTVAVISGLQFLLAFIGYDIASVPRTCLHRFLMRRAPNGRLNTAKIAGDHSLGHLGRET